MKPTSDEGKGNQEEIQPLGGVNKQGRPENINNSTAIILDKEKNASSPEILPSNLVRNLDPVYLALIPAANPHSPEFNKKSWLCQYFKMKTIDGSTYNVCQANKTPSGSFLCMAKLAYLRKTIKYWCNHEKYNTQEVIPAAKKMIDKLESYFYLCIQKHVYLCSMLLDPRIKTNLLTPDLLTLLKLSQKEILLMSKGEANKFFKNQSYEKENSQRDDEGNSKNTLKSTLF
ncbi:uncharacterized protein VP01_236g7 [Puccinia sorghi]|uniref:Uncharacterized protein n=1 Tax=Puccinia sorghi TaxID=27349 RepID=A0A0L6V902_9BASI|nr:uncharacterized protein VP01_236g7 [Puccinia sorghi]